jgi:hypothetical protein
MVRAIPGQGFFKHNKAPPVTSLSFSGVKLMQMPPVSVFHHQVPTTAHFSLPTILFFLSLFAN